MGLSTFVAILAADSESQTKASPVPLLLLLVVIGLLVAGFALSKKRSAANRAKWIAVLTAEQVARVSDRLAAEGEIPRSVVPVHVATPYIDSKGVRRDQWIARTLAVTSDHLIVVDLQGGRATFGLADVVTTSTNHGLLAIALSNGAELRHRGDNQVIEIEFSVGRDERCAGFRAASSDRRCRLVGEDRHVVVQLVCAVANQPLTSTTMSAEASVKTQTLPSSPIFASAALATTWPLM